MTPAVLAPLLRSLAWVAGLFSAAILVVLVTNVPHVQPPLDDAQLVALGRTLVEHKDAAVAARFRQRDAALRTHYLSRTALQRHGGVLLVGGLLAMVAALRLARTLERRIEDPRTNPLPDPWRQAAAARHGVLVGGVALSAILGGLAWSGRDTTPAAPPEPEAPTAADLAKAWPSFRGPYAAGAVSGAMPGAWNGVTGQGIRWAVDVPLPGASSPVVWQSSIFLTGGEAKRREVYCFAASDGKLQWTGVVPPSAQELEPFADTGFAAPTPVCDGRRVVALFADGQLAGFDLTGRRRWLQSLGVPVSQYTYAASLALWQDLVIVQWDVGEEPGKSALIAYDILTGRQRWKTQRPVQNGWGSPVATADGAVVCNGNPWVAEYDAATGAERWRAKLMEGDVATSPFVTAGQVVVANARACMAVIKRGGNGDVTASGIQWKNDEALPDQASPVCDGSRVVTISDTGAMTCRSLGDGRKLWEHTYDHIVRSTPLIAGGRFWILDENGIMHVVPSADTYSEEAVFPLVAEDGHEKCFATPAVVAGTMYLRGAKKLFAIGAKP